MSAVVIDTNVLLVANQQHQDISAECVLACAKKLLEAQQQGIIVIDDDYRIIREYSNKPKQGIIVIDDDYRIIREYSNKPNCNGTRVGDVFLKWLLQNQANTAHVHQVTITETLADHFQEFPDQILQPHFDAPDRKFPSVANAHPDKPPVLQAADCKWINWQPALDAAGISVDFVCPHDICRFYGNKFPGQPVPVLL